MLNREQAHAIVEKAMVKTRKYATATLMASEQNTTRFANSEISQNVAIEDAELSITVYEGKKQATRTTNVLTGEGISDAIKEAENLLAFVPEGEFGIFPFSKEETAENESDGKLAAAFGMKERAAIVKEGVEQVKEGFYAAGALNMNRHSLAVGNSLGRFRYTAYDMVEFNTVVTHADGSAGAGAKISFDTVPDIVAEFAKAQATASAARGALEPPLGAHTVILSPLAFGDLVRFMSYMLNAKSVDDGASFAIGKLGQKVFGDRLTVRDDVIYPGLRPLHFDTEGNPRRSLALVENGVIKNFLHDNITATKHNTEPTGHAIPGYGGYPANLVVGGGSRSLEELIASTPRGIFINEFHYTNFVNPRNLQMTGLTRNGTFLIEDGKITKPIATVRFTESLLDAFNNITGISRETELSGEWSVGSFPAVRIENFHFTSKP
jgi:predicted Zn-dependent protease